MSKKTKRFDKQFGGRERVRWMQQLNCVACGNTPCEVAHVKSRGAGGTAKDTVPLCAKCHFEQHAKGIRTFERKWQVDLTAKAAQYAEWWDERGGYDLGF